MTVKVKKLEWRGSADWGWWMADTTFPGRGYYIVREDTDSLRPFVHRSDWLPGPENRFETLERAINFVMVEPELRKGLTRRVFRRMLDGSLEWAAYDDWRTHNERARFFGFASRDLPTSMTS